MSLPEGLSNIQTYVQPVASRAIAISEEVYLRLSALQRSGETFSQLVDRRIPRPSLLDLANALPRRRVRVLRRAVTEGRSRSRKRGDRPGGS